MIKGQWLAGKLTLNPFGMRQIMTLQNDPKQAPKIKNKT